jgi:hypothetical protein
VKKTGRATDAARFHDGPEDLDLTQIHSASPSSDRLASGPRTGL